MKTFTGGLRVFPFFVGLAVTVSGVTRGESVSQQVPLGFTDAGFYAFPDRHGAVPDVGRLASIFSDPLNGKPIRFRYDPKRPDILTTPDGRIFAKDPQGNPAFEVFFSRDTLQRYDNRGQPVYTGGYQTSTPYGYQYQGYKAATYDRTILLAQAFPPTKALAGAWFEVPAKIQEQAVGFMKANPEALKPERKAALKQFLGDGDITVRLLPDDQVSAKLGKGEDADVASKVAALNFWLNAVSLKNGIALPLALREKAAQGAVNEKFQPEAFLPVDLREKLDAEQLELIFRENPYDCSHPRYDFRKYLKGRTPEEHYTGRKFEYPTKQAYSPWTYSYDPVNYGWLLARILDKNVLTKLLKQKNLQQIARDLQVFDTLKDRDVPFAKALMLEPAQSPIAEGQRRMLLHQPSPNPELVRKNGGTYSPSHGQLGYGGFYQWKRKYDAFPGHFILTYDQFKEQKVGNAEAAIHEEFPTTFTFDGAEGFYTQGNRIMKPLLTNNQGALQDFAPTHLVSFTHSLHPSVRDEEVEGDKQIDIFECYYCHDRGPYPNPKDSRSRPFVDALNRKFEQSLFTGAPLGPFKLVSADPLKRQQLDAEQMNRLKTLFGTSTEFNAIKDDVQRGHLEDVHWSGGGFPHPDEASRLMPVGNQVERTYRRPLSFNQASRELGIREDALERLIEKDPILRDLANLRNYPAEKSISRANFERVFCLVKLLAANDPELPRLGNVNDLERIGHGLRSMWDGAKRVAAEGTAHDGKSGPADGKSDTAAPAVPGGSPSGVSQGTGAGHKSPAPGAPPVRPAGAPDAPVAAKAYASTGSCTTCHNPTDVGPFRVAGKEIDLEDVSGWKALLEDPATKEDAVKRIDQVIGRLTRTTGDRKRMPPASSEEELVKERKFDIKRLQKALETLRRESGQN